MKISLVVSAYNQPEPLGKVLRAIARQTRMPDEVLIADDGSDQRTAEVVRANQKFLPVAIQHLWHEDHGFRKNMILNKAVAQSSGDYVVFLDGDCVPDRRFVADHTRLAERGYWVQGRRCFVEERFVSEFEPDKTALWKWIFLGRITGWPKGIRLPIPVIFRNTKQRGIIGCNMAFWRDDLMRVNGFDETNYVGSGIGEDSDLGTRVYHLGVPRKFVYAHAVVFHLNHSVSPRELERNRSQLEQVLRTRKIRCEVGLDQYLPQPANAR